MSTVSGRRKEATAVVKLTKGTGMVTVNKRVSMNTLEEMLLK